MSASSYRFTCEAAERLDKFLTRLVADISRNRIQTLISDGYVTVNDRPAEKSGQMLADGDVVALEMPAPEPSSLLPEDIPLDIIFENDQLMVVNKPAGMVVHPAAGHSRGTLVHAALGHAPELEGIGGEVRPGVVHRLDKDTSGLIILAKTDKAHRWLQEQFRLRKVEKVYMALVDGKPPTPSGRIEAPIGRDPSHRKKMAIVQADKGREAVTEYRTAESFAAHTLLEAHPLTGRTHQIRLHMAFLGCPIVGDTLYGRRKQSVTLERHFLHAAKLTITLPGERTPQTFTAPLPPELSGVLDVLRQH